MTAPRVDEIGFGSLRILQDPEAFCYGVDAVLLAGFSTDRLKEMKGKNQANRLCDLGTGTGIVPLILSHKTSINDIWGVEVQETSFRLAEETAVLNHLEDRLHFHWGNVQDLSDPVAVEALGGSGSFDAVTMNPPYTAANCGMEAGNTAKTIARHEVKGNVEDFVVAARTLLRDKGHLFLVHRPGRLVDLCETARKFGMEPRELQLVSGKEQEAPNILLMHCVKNGGRELKVLPPLFVRKPDGSFSQELLRIYERAPMK